MRPMQRGTYARFRRQETQRREQNAVRNRKRKAVMNIGRGHLNAHEQDDKDNNDGEESNGKGEDEKGQVTHKEQLSLKLKAKARNPKRCTAHDERKYMGAFAVEAN